ncbi:MAG: nucleotidyltransferase domain-containing protein [Chloroflexi bacterium]|nr:nucleotidyltransferase domain-containing protein [Chloroflexota bacterium]MBU1749214.1 nucleotidyltransferase domain-containing protein [Chloroflexota bacterium]MBU1879997.1 nucleotidyltransferase domain-containing protein [Chloroflexota bacterium]
MDELAGLTPNEQQAVRAFVARVRGEYGARVLLTTLFGSKARGDSSHDSDVDILLVVDSEDWRLHKALRVLAARVSLEYDVLLSPRIIGQERWAEMRHHRFTLYEHVQADGIALTSVG